jgi:hypothetical protein
VKRLGTILALVAAGLALLVVAAGAGTRDFTGPACLNIQSGDFGYVTTDSGGFPLPHPYFDGSMSIGDFPCQNAQYTLFLFDNTSASGSPIATITVNGSDLPASQTVTFPRVFLNQPAPSFVCVRGETRNGDEHVSDSAPDAFPCSIVAGGSSGGGTGFD